MSFNFASNAKQIVWSLSDRWSMLSWMVFQTWRGHLLFSTCKFISISISGKLHFFCCTSHFKSITHQETKIWVFQGLNALVGFQIVRVQCFTICNSGIHSVYFFPFVQNFNAQSYKGITRESLPEANEFAGLVSSMSLFQSTILKTSSSLEKGEKWLFSSIPSSI